MPDDHKIESLPPDHPAWTLPIEDTAFDVMVSEATGAVVLRAADPTGKIVWAVPADERVLRWMGAQFLAIADDLELARRRRRAAGQN